MKKIIIAGLTLVIAALFFIWSGIYNISATEKHWEITNSLIEILRDRSISVRAEDIKLPDNLQDESKIAAGAANFSEMCATCHLAPGMTTTELHQGLYPRPPVFYQAEAEHEDHAQKNNFWVIKNGIKLTGMPAWGGSHSDEEIWALVAFIDRLKDLSAEEYNHLISLKKAQEH